MIKIAAILAFTITFMSCNIEKEPIYMDVNQPVNKRVDDLMSRMTLEEKVGQMCQWVGLEHMIEAERDLTIEELSNNTARGFYPGVTVDDVKQMIVDGKIGSFLHVLTSSEANYLQSIASKSRLKIPLLIGIDAIHGNAMVSGTTIYPTTIGQASMFDVDLVREICRQTAIEMRATGSHWTFNPNVEVARDPRWGRVGETFGEDTYLVSVLGVASIEGYQGKDFLSHDNVIACAKHFVGGGQSINGTNGAPTDISERTLREVHFPSFKSAVEAGVFSFMPGHNELNGIPSHANNFLLTDVLRNEWKFKGFVVSDWMDMERIHDLHATAVDYKDAYMQSVNAGVDIHMHGPNFFEYVLELVKEGKISKKRINTACAKILEAKFKLGLFEKVIVNEEEQNKVLRNPIHLATSLEAARKSIVLLTNNGILPLAENKYKNVLITGSNVNNQAILGDWTMLQPNDNVITILDGLKKIATNTNFSFIEQNWNLKEMCQLSVDKAVINAKAKDLAIVVVGEYSLRYNWHDRTCGEDCDRSDIELVGLQQQLVERIVATGTPTIVVLVNGRQLGLEWIARNSAALIEAWEPGDHGGLAVAEIIYGITNPSAKLPVTIPRSVGQLQMIYNHKPSMYFHPYVITESTPLFPFGHGLSYSKFCYSNLKLTATEYLKNDSIELTVDVENTGLYDGEEVVQLYIRDIYSSATRPVKELKGFQRVFLRKGTKKNVKFKLPVDKLAYYNSKMEWGVEAGDFYIMIGGSSQETDQVKGKVTIK